MNKKLLIGLIAAALVFAFGMTGVLYAVIPNVMNVVDAPAKNSVVSNVTDTPSDLENLANGTKHEHTVVIDVEVLPTCTSTGLTEGKHCAECGAVIVAQEEVPMVPHTYTDANDEDCNVCGHLRGDECAHMYTEVLPAVAPTCTTTGLTEGLRCEVCSATLRAQVVVGKIAHSAGNWIVDKTPTKTEDGSKHTNCTMCGIQVNIQKIPATGSIGLRYELNEDKKSYNVSIGTSRDTEIVILAEYNGKPVTKIADNGFLNCNRIVSVYMPDSIEEIGRYAFGYCESLNDINLPNGLESIGDYAFRYCTSLETVVIPNSVKTIGDYAFRYCIALSDLTIGKGVTDIGDYAFYKCISLEEVSVPANVSNIEWAVFAECASLVDIAVDVSNKYYKSVDGNLYTKDGTMLMQYAVGKPAQAFDVPSGVTHIDDFAFRGAVYLVNVEIPGTVAHIGSGAFYNCSALESVEIPNGVENIAHSLFRNCTSLVSVVIPNSVESIDGSAFYKCVSLEEVTIPDKVKSIGSSAFYMCSSLTSVTIPDSVYSLGEYAFYNCMSLESVEIGRGIKQIKDYTFYNCTALVSVDIPSSVKTICNYVFANCSSLESIEFDGTVHTWMTVEKGMYWNQNVKNDNVICTDGTTSK